jgi:hypothetical protein
MVYIVAVNNSAMLVFLMQAGFTMLEAGAVRERNVSQCRASHTLVFLSSTAARSLDIHASPIPCPAAPPLLPPPCKAVSVSLICLVPRSAPLFQKTSLSWA